MAKPNVSSDNMQDNLQARPSASPARPILAYASLILGILSLVLGGWYAIAGLRGLPFVVSFVVGVIGVVIGHLARAQMRRAGAPRRLEYVATVGLALSYAGAILSLGLFALLRSATPAGSPPGPSGLPGY
jgi:Na+/glutamate symporter